MTRRKGFSKIEAIQVQDTTERRRDDSQLLFTDRILKKSDKGAEVTPFPLKRKLTISYINLPKGEKTIKMNTQQLDKGRLLNEEIEDKRSLLKRIKGEGDGQIVFSQSNSINRGAQIVTSEKKEYTGFDLQVQTILLATKQTLISILEREIERLEKEFENI